MRKSVLFLLVLVSFLSARANNVQLQGTVKVVSATGSLVTMEVDLSWENSWRDDYNWDATWLFFKYKSGVNGAWQHAAINATTAAVTGGDYTTMSATTVATAQGLFVYPDKDRGGNTGSLKVQVQWKTSYTQAQFDNNDVFVVAHGIEMVYVPYGAYTIGDGSSTDSFTKQVIDSEAVFGTANAAYPKGYQGFYVMKYETSQEQYVEFLNTLTLAEQKELIPGVDALSVGNFVFGANKAAPNYRNSIILSGKIAGKPLFFDNNLNNNKVYSEDGDGGTLAMNYMSITDACGYASWAGLRPMTEMEYEKACRRPYPQEPDAGEFAWNSAVGAVNASGLTMQGSGREIAATGNVNASGTINGPVRCGIFARPTTASQAAAGATYWGVMEMSGNVSELCANITNTTISKTVNGTGCYNTSLFGSGPTGYGTRGGGFGNTHNTLTTSSRAAVSCFTDALQRDSTVGFRCVFTYTTTNVVNAGTINASLATVCPGDRVTFSGTPATAGALKITGYIWSVKIGTGAFMIIPGECGATLTYSNFVSNTTYVFKRKAVFPLGEAEVVSKPYTIPNTAAFSISPLTATLENCSATSVTASGITAYSWKYLGSELATTASYTPSKAHFLGLTTGNVTVSCTGVIGGCSVTKDITVTFNMGAIVQTFRNCGDLLTDYCSNTYTTKLMADGRCWMTQNMRRTDVAYTYPDNSASNAVTHGCHYDWNTVMQGSTAESAQGVCPVGWHIPYDGEWDVLVNVYGGDNTAGASFKKSSIFNMTLSGYSGAYTFGSNGLYWSSSESGTDAWYRLVTSGNAIGRYSVDKTCRFSLRCVLD